MVGRSVAGVRVCVCVRAIEIRLPAGLSGPLLSPAGPVLVQDAGLDGPALALSSTRALVLLF